MCRDSGSATRTQRTTRLRGNAYFYLHIVQYKQFSWVVSPHFLRAWCTTQQTSGETLRADNNNKKEQQRLFPRAGKQKIHETTTKKEILFSDPKTNKPLGFTLCFFHPIPPSVLKKNQKLTPWDNSRSTHMGRVKGARQARGFYHLGTAYRSRGRSLRENPRSGTARSRCWPRT